uniref:Uncharacterized protein n=1 Tax=Odontella aurita TaxID=265563 RepID=A0A7S4ML36_9STRA
MDVDEETGKGNATTDAGADDAAKTDNQDKSSSDGSDADDEDEEEKDDDGAEDFKADANAMKGEDDNGEEGDKAKSLEVKKENTCEKKEDDKAAAKDKEAQEKEKNNNDKKSSSPLSSLPKKRKLLSLAPCPSFHDQHRRRLLLLHADLLAHNIADHARKRVAEATEEYNTAFRKSSALQDQRVRVQNELNRMLREHRAQGSNRRNDHAVKVAVARTMHAKRREKWMVSRAERKNRALQAANAGMNDPAGVVARALGCAVDRSVIMEEDPRHPPAGTEGTRGYAAASSRRADAVGVEVGTVLGHAVDAVCVRFDLTHRRPLNRGPWTDDRSGAAARSIGAETFPEFVPPPPDEEDDPVVDPKTGETRSQRHERLESDARRSFAEVSDRLARSEEGRKNAWRKLLKTKAECEGPANHGGNYRRKGAQMAAQNAAAAAAASLPAPPLKHGSRGGGGGSASSRAAAAAAAAGYRRPNPPQHGRMAVPHPIPPPNPAALAHALGHTPSSKSKGGGSRRVHPPSSGGRSSSARSSSASSSAAAVSASAASVANQSDSKYSAERIRARKYSDGSVRPATMPKRDKNGLYMRPAGRRRKGMNWDAVKGVWIPTDNPDPRFGE